VGSDGTEMVEGHDCGVGKLACEGECRETHGGSKHRTGKGGEGQFLVGGVRKNAWGGVEFRRKGGSRMAREGWDEIGIKKQKKGTFQGGENDHVNDKRTFQTGKGLLVHWTGNERV